MSNSSSDDENFSNESCDTKQEKRKATFTEEQKIVSAVWMHERPFNYQTIEDVQNNFCIRFKAEPPGPHALMNWEKRLFSSGAFARERKRGPLKRLVHVPYVKASLKEKPGLTMNERACQLGLPLKVLRQILRHDIKDSDLNQENITNVQDTTIDNGEVQIKNDNNSD